MFTVVVSEANPTISTSTPPDPVGLAGTATYRGVWFTWSLDTWIRPCKWQYDLKIGAGAYSGTWTDTLFPQVLRTLTLAELASAGVNGLITIKVRSTNSLGTYSNVVEASANCLALALALGDIASGLLTLAKLNSEVTDKMFASTDRDGADLKATSVALAKLKTDATNLMFATSARVAADTALVNGVAAATISVGAAAGALANAKLTTDGVQTGGATIPTTTTITDAIDDRLTATEKTNLETALGTALATIDASIVSTGTDGTASTLKATLKTDIDLDNVDNKGSATIRSEIVDGDLAATTAILEGTFSTFIADTPQIGVVPSAAIDTVKATKVIDNTTSTPLFDASGNLTFGALSGIGVKSGSTVISPDKLILAVHTDGTSKNLDFTKPKSGQTLDNVPNGSTYKLVTANEKTGALRAYTALDSSNKLTTGTTNKTVAQIEQDIGDYHVMTGTPNQATSAVITGSVLTDVTGDGTDQLIYKTDIQKLINATTINVGLNYLSDGSATIKCALCDALGNPLSPTVTDSDGVTTTVGAYLTLAQTLTIPSNGAAGTWYQVRVYQNMLVGVDVKIKDITVGQTK